MEATGEKGDLVSAESENILVAADDANDTESLLNTVDFDDISWGFISTDEMDSEKENDGIAAGVRGDLFEANDENDTESLPSTVSMGDSDSDEPSVYQAIDEIDLEDSEASEDEEDICIACCEHKAKAVFSRCGHQCICLQCKYIIELREERSQMGNPDRMYRCIMCLQISTAIIRVVY